MTQGSPRWRSALEQSVLAPTGVTALWPTSEGYDAARTVFNRMHDRRPGAILRRLTPDGVARAVGFARDRGLDLTMRGGGHHIAGFAVCDDGIVLDFSQDREVSIDAAGVVAVAPGARLADLDEALVPRGLAVPTGTVSDTGIAGLTLGGGIGWLTGRHGLTCDHLVAADLVTADGVHHRVDARTQPDLLWGLRGGGGNFGVVTRFYFQPVALDRVVAGRLRSGAVDLAAALGAVLDWLASACPAELTVAPVLRRTSHGVELSVEFCLVGDDQRAALEHLVRVVRPAEARYFANREGFLAWQRSLDGAFREPLRGYWKARYVDTLDAAAVRGLIDRLDLAPAAHASVTLEHLHGVFADRDPASSAFPIRGRKLGTLVSARWRDAADDAANRAWVRSCFPAPGAGEAQATYSNYSEGAESVIDGYPADVRSRLRRVKAQFDPHNVFRHNHNITRPDAT